MNVTELCYRWISRLQIEQPDGPWTLESSRFTTRRGPRLEAGDVTSSLQSVVVPLPSTS